MSYIRGSRTIAGKEQTSNNHDEEGFIGKKVRQGKGRQELRKVDQGNPRDKRNLSLVKREITKGGTTKVSGKDKSTRPQAMVLENQNMEHLIARITRGIVTMGGTVLDLVRLGLVNKLFHDVACKVAKKCGIVVWPLIIQNKEDFEAFKKCLEEKEKLPLPKLRIEVLGNFYEGLEEKKKTEFAKLMEGRHKKEDVVNFVYGYGLAKDVRIPGWVSELQLMGMADKVKVTVPPSVKKLESRGFEMPDMSNATGLEEVMIGHIYGKVTVPPSVKKLKTFGIIGTLDMSKAKVLEEAKLGRFHSGETVVVPSSVKKLEVGMIEKRPLDLSNATSLEVLKLEIICGPAVIKVPASVKQLEVGSVGWGRLLLDLSEATSLEEVKLGDIFSRVAVPASVKVLECGKIWGTPGVLDLRAAVGLTRENCKISQLKNLGTVLYPDNFS